MNQKISVIVPIYKVEQYLNRCIESIINQTYKNLEIILVDDGSPDNCPKICDEWAEKDSRIRVIHKENGGLSDARNYGIEIATGDYIAFVDSDDWLSLGYYEKMMNAIMEYDAQIVASEVIWSYSDRQETYGRRFEQKLFTTEEALNTLINGEGFRAVAWNKVYERNLFEGIKYPINKIHEDEFVTYRLMARARRLALCCEAKYYYRQRNGSIMTSFSTKRLDAMEAYFERLEFLKKNYHSLYVKDKATLCMLCAAYYKEGMRLPNYEFLEIRKRIKKYRKNIKCSFKELRTYSMKEMIYVIGTGINLEVFCYFKEKFRREF